MAGFLGSVFLGAFVALLIGTFAGGFFLESPILGLFVWPIGAIALPVYQYRRELRRQRRPPNW